MGTKKPRQFQLPGQNCIYAMTKRAPLHGTSALAVLSFPISQCKQNNTKSMQCLLLILSETHPPQNL